MRSSNVTSSSFIEIASSSSSGEWIDLGQHHPEFDSDEMVEQLESTHLTSSANTQLSAAQERLGEWLNILRKDVPDVYYADDLKGNSETKHLQEQQLSSISDTLAQHLNTDPAQFRARIAPYLKYNKYESDHVSALHDLALRLRGTPYWLERDRIAHLEWCLDSKKDVQLQYKKRRIRLLPEDQIYLIKCEKTCPLSLTEYPTKLFSKVTELMPTQEKKSRISPASIIGKWIDDFLSDVVGKDKNQRSALLAIAPPEGKIQTAMAVIRDIFMMMLSSGDLSPQFISGLTSAHMGDEETALLMPAMSTSQKALLKELMHHVEVTSGSDASLFPSASFGKSTAEKMRTRLSRVSDSATKINV